MRSCHVKELGNHQDPFAVAVIILLVVVGGRRYFVDRVPVKSGYLLYATKIDKHSKLAKVKTSTVRHTY